MAPTEAPSWAPQGRDMPSRGGGGRITPVDIGQGVAHYSKELGHFSLGFPAQAPPWPPLVGAGPHWPLVVSGSCGRPGIHSRTPHRRLKLAQFDYGKKFSEIAQRRACQAGNLSTRREGVAGEPNVPLQDRAQPSQGPSEWLEGG